MFPHSVKEAIPEVLLGLRICHPTWVLELYLFEGSLQPGGKWGDLLIVSLAYFIEILPTYIKLGHFANDDWQFMQDMINASCGPHIPSPIHCGPLQWLNDALSDHQLQIVILNTLDLMVQLLKRHLSLPRSGITPKSIVTRDTHCKSPEWLVGWQVLPLLVKQ